MRKLTRVLVGVGAGTSGLYWGALSIFAANVDLCPTGSFNTIPGCKGADLGKIIGSALNALLFVAFVAALIFLIVGGIRWILSGGDKEGTAKAKGTVTSALIGLAIVLGAWILINLVLQFFTGAGLTQLTIPQLGQ